MRKWFSAPIILLFAGVCWADEFPPTADLYGVVESTDEVLALLEPVDARCGLPSCFPERQFGLNATENITGIWAAPDADWSAAEKLPLIDVATATVATDAAEAPAWDSVEFHLEVTDASSGQSPWLMAAPIATTIPLDPRVAGAAQLAAP